MSDKIVWQETHGILTLYEKPNGKFYVVIKETVNHVPFPPLPIWQTELLSLYRVLKKLFKDDPRPIGFELMFERFNPEKTKTELGELCFTCPYCRTTRFSVRTYFDDDQRGAMVYCTCIACGYRYKYFDADFFGGK